MVEGVRMVWSCKSVAPVTCLLPESVARNTNFYIFTLNEHFNNVEFNSFTKQYFKNINIRWTPVLFPI
jgi:hypothetical protein